MSRRFFSLNPVVCYRSNTSYDAEVAYDFNGQRAQFLIAKNFPTNEAAEKMAEDFCNDIQDKLFAIIQENINNKLKKAKE